MDQPAGLHGEGTGWWDRLDELVDEAGALPAAERDSFLDSACTDEPGLRAEVTSLLAHADSGADILSSIATALFPRGGGPDDVPAPDPFIGQRIHQYTIETRLGGGGMGVVYRALDTRLGRPVALKFIWPGAHGDDAGKRQLLTEAQAAAALDHPNVCTIHEVGESPDGGLFIAMGYYEGETLKGRLARSPLPVEEAVHIVRQVAEGLRAAHARGVIHCDIKPGNILITGGGVVKLLDFGVARHGEGSLADRAGFAGTTAYMSPEQFGGGPVDARSDIWSLGVVAYEVLTGRRPFQGHTPNGTMYAILHAAPLR